jgi:hypothetical protein
LRDVAKAGPRAECNSEIALVHHGQDGARNQVPVFANRDRDDGLKQDRVLLAVAIAEAFVVIELERYADEAGDGVDGLLGKLLCRLGGGRLRQGRKCDQEDDGMRMG